MKRYILKKTMVTPDDGYIDVVVQGEDNVLNRTMIRSREQFFTTVGGYNYNHPYDKAVQTAQAIANALNNLEGERASQRRQIVNNPDYTGDFGRLTADQVEDIFRGDLGRQIDSIFTTPDGRAFIRHEEARSHCSKEGFPENSIWIYHNPYDTVVEEGGG